MGGEREREREGGRRGREEKEQELRVGMVSKSRKNLLTVATMISMGTTTTRGSMWSRRRKRVLTKMTALLRRGRGWNLSTGTCLCLLLERRGISDIRLEIHSNQLFEFLIIFFFSILHKYTSGNDMSQPANISQGSC